MLTRRQLQRIAQRHHIGLQAQERDYLQHLLTALTPAHLFGEKVRALIVRGKPRDLYDLWLMHGKGWRLDREVVARKLALYDLEFTPEALKEAADGVAPDWERDLRPLLPQFVAFDEARRVLATLEAE